MPLRLLKSSTSRSARLSRSIGSGTGTSRSPYSRRAGASYGGAPTSSPGQICTQATPAAALRVKQPSATAPEPSICVESGGGFIPLLVFQIEYSAYVWYEALPRWSIRV